ncbi:sensor histidine kinase [Spirosoma sp. KUDC1026]|uniref:sensor histidine kinase n=1 Tax=Spirosoma sp. KUDC1026 TaxID=2745947 RepID=UPI00159B8E87|nr:histidine kinase [Spirosoma sp. KUDC1026]QKZ11764.1 histidine kinase [Spirosoma sp. KUDC1026]
MQSALLTVAASEPFVKRWLWNREIRIFLIHYGVWVIVSLIGGWLELQFIPADRLEEATPILAHYRNDWWGYVQMTLIADLVYLIPVHVSYWVFQRSMRTGRAWALVLFGLYMLVYFFVQSLLYGILVGALGWPVKNQEALSTIVITWIYTVIFIAVRAYRQNRRRQKELELQRTRAELQALKAQVNPHFMFNTLNNLYGTAITGNMDRTAAGIEQLSSVMRHITEASQQDVILIEQELRFVEDTVELHRMRVPQTESIQIRAVMDWDEKPAQIAPLLLNPLVENAFKYGISMQRPSFVDISIRVTDGTLTGTIRNSIVSRTQLEKGTGTGLKNVRQRLALAYPNRHLLRIEQTNDEFIVYLTINL